MMAKLIFLFRFVISI